MVPGSTLMYGSSFMTETLSDRLLSRRPMLATLTPLPTPLSTPPVTKMNLRGVPPVMRMPCVSTGGSCRRGR